MSTQFTTEELKNIDKLVTTESTVLSPLLKAALWYTTQGWAVFPLGANNKLPVKGSSGYLDATKDEAVVRQMWAQHPYYNIGVATGHVSGIVTIDFDCKKEQKGLESKKAWEAEHGPLITRTAYTPTGGIHLIYQMPMQDIRNSASLIAPGVDVRANGGYIAVAPSSVGDKIYTFEDPIAPVEPLPGWLLTLLLTKKEAKVVALSEGEPIPVGRRNDTLFRIACANRRYGLGADHLYMHIRSLNKALCTEPIPDAELRLIAEEAAQYKPDYTGEIGNSDGERWLRHSMLQDGSWGVPTNTRQSQLQAAGAIATKPVYQRFTLEEITTMTGQEITYLAKPFVPQGAIIDLFAKIKAGKTILALNLAAALCEGGLFLGEKTKQTPVIYLTEQSMYSFKAEADLLWPSGKPADGLFVFFLHDARKAQLSWRDIVDHTVRECQEVGARMVVVDTFSAWAGFGENQENDSGMADKAIAELSKLTAAGVTVMIVRHGRKSGGEISDAARGSSAIGGGADVLLYLKHKEGGSPGSRKRVLEATGRYPLPPEALEIELGEHNRYICNGVAVSDQAKQDKQMILDTLNSVDWMSRGQLMDITGLTKTRLHRAISRLEFDQVIEHKGTGSKANPFQHRKLI